MLSAVTLRNNAAHMKHLSLGGGVVIHIPPTLDGEPGVTFTPAVDDLADRLVLALNAMKVEWIDTGELQANGVDYGPEALAAASERMQARAEAAKRAKQQAEEEAKASKLPPTSAPPPPPPDDPPTDEIPAPPPESRKGKR